MCMIHRLLIISLILLAGAGCEVAAQKKVRLISTENWVYDKALLDAQRLIGQVHLEYEGTHFYADSAYLFPNDNFDAFGHIQMIKAGEYTLTGETMHFEESIKTATVRKNVTLRDGQMTLQTDYLDYNTRTGIANYAGGGRIVSSKDQNQLRSDKGSYNSKTQVFYFKKNVELKNPDYKVYSDTLQYFELSETAYFFGPTNIIGDSTRLYCENGFYNTKLDQSRFGKNAIVTSGKIKLKGDSIFYDGQKGIGEVFRRVSIADTTAGVQIHGEYGKHRESDSYSFVTNKAWLYQDLGENDSLFVRADSLFLIGNEQTKNIMKAYRDVSFFHTDLQGICDSLVYFEKDSLLELHHQPIMWHGNNQMTCDTVRMTLRNGGPDQLFMRSNAMIIGKAIEQSLVPSDTVLLHQIKGRDMTGQFLQGELRSLRVEGNGQLIYFPESDKKETPHIIGHNKGDCSNILITIKDRKIEKIRLEEEPRSIYSPMSKAPKDNLLLPGAAWKADQRPLDARAVKYGTGLN
jgi:lipopolysaccharide export system protein LptA